MNALDLMARFEEDGLHFFETVWNTTTDPEMKELFGILADNQKHHLNDLDKLKVSMTGIETDCSLIDRAGELVNGFRSVLVSPDIRKELKNDPDAFDRIVKAEDGMIDLLKGMAKAEQEENTRELLELLAEEEMEHLNRMENIYEFVEAPRTYLEWGEFSNLHSL
jgi:rubrerythrin